MYAETTAQLPAPSPPGATSPHGATSAPCTTSPRWPLERVLFALAGSVTLISALLAAVVSPWFLLLTAFAGLNQWLYVLVGACPASLILKRACGFRSVVYPSRDTHAE
jgi:fatty acid desaturase